MSSPFRIWLGMHLVLSYAREIFRGIASFARTNGHWQMIPGTHQLGPQTGRDLATLDVDGLILMIATPHARDAAAACRLPMVNTSGVYSGLPHPQVISDDYAIGRLAAEHLLEQGHHSFGYVGYSDLNYSCVRGNGFADTLAKANETVARLEVPAASLHLVAGLDDWLAAIRRPGAIMACNDHVAADLMALLAARRIRVPEDLVIIGVDNDDLVCDLVNPPLTSVQPDSHKIGFEAAALLDRVMHGKAPPTSPIVVPPLRVVRRASTAALPVDHPVVLEALRWMQDHLNENVAISELATQLKVSRRSLELWFRAARGRSPSAELARLRLERVKQLLIETDLKLSAIAAATGFSTEAMLCRTFRARTGETTSQYRRRFRVHS